MVSLKKKKQNNKVLSLKLLKNKIYKLNKKKIFSETKTTVKTTLKLIFKYQMFNKKILFLGTSKRLNTFFLHIINKTKHFFVPQIIWFNGVLTNPEVLFKHILLTKNIFKEINRLASIRREVNLILSFGKNKTELNCLKVPVISFAGFTQLCDYYVNFPKTNRLNLNLFTFFLKTLKKKVKFLKPMFNKAI